MFYFTTVELSTHLEGNLYFLPDVRTYILSGLVYLCTYVRTYMRYTQGQDEECICTIQEYVLKQVLTNRVPLLTK